MKILFVSNRLPFAGVAGGYSIIYERVVGLARHGHQVGVVAFSRDETPGQVEKLRRNLYEVELVTAPHKRGFLRRVYDYFFCPVPSRFRWYRSNEMKKMVGNMVERSQYDVVITEFARMAQHIYKNPYLPAVRKVVSCHRSLTMLHQNELQYLGWGPVSLFQRLRLKGMESFEFNLYRNADHVIVLTPQERFWMLSRLPRVHISVVQSGVDTKYYTHDPSRLKEHAIVFTGNYRDSANEDAMRWFLKAVWPLLSEKEPELLFYIVGPSPSRAMQHLASRYERVRIAGHVDDLRTYLYRSKVLVCPVRVGAGIRTKVLEAMASGVPVVSTVLGVEGIPALVGYNCFLADHADIMCDYIHLLLKDEELAQDIAGRARKMIEERFSWDNSIERLEQTLERFVTVQNQ